MSDNYENNIPGSESAEHHYYRPEQSLHSPPDSAPAGEPLFIAMALLPPEVDVGTRLHYEMFSYTVIE